MNVLKPGEAMSHGRIMRIKKEESSLIAKQTKEFFKNGGKIKTLNNNESASLPPDFQSRNGKKAKPVKTK